MLKKIQNMFVELHYKNIKLVRKLVLQNFYIQNLQAKRKNNY
jgi:hypothetical protein